MPPPSALKKLNSYVFISEPIDAETTLLPSERGTQKPALKPPGLIILFTWMDAKLIHIQKYVDTFHELFPSSTIVAVTQAALAPLMTILHREKENGRLENGILVHTMSNGGSFQLVVFQKMLMKSALGAAFEPPTALCLDSAPGEDALDIALRANSPQNPLLRVIATPVILFLYGVHRCFFQWLVGKPPMVAEMRAKFLSPAVLPGLSSDTHGKTKATPRLYVYSETDEVMQPEGIRKHADQAIAAGFDVRVERYEISPHVAHARTDPERYWNAVRQLWLRALEDGGKHVKL
ncbi:hypothetical protein NLJ89_g10303 [Agrocybe chaxingu]|uniref:Indole-diterpene biosynthesis protein PaxU n=1 Tax=Agrocybe chaxingu TaxID=84603 RepID=A0A9W8JQU9_9AGAR|nr:hypothetical protein NLJ89_g10303 [Agrocybe chaxingu]